MHRVLRSRTIINMTEMGETIPEGIPEGLPKEMWLEFLLKTKEMEAQAQ